MSQEFYLILTIFIICFAIIIWLINKKLSALAEKTKPDENLIRLIESLQRNEKELRNDLHIGLQNQSKSINKRLDNAAHYISQVALQVGKMSELGQSMRDLQMFLQSPKLRGNIGEQVLKDLIGQAFPRGSFHLQYTFKSGEKVDAAIKTSAGILPIDSKFPMENFKLMFSSKESKYRQTAKKAFVNDVKKHIRDISKKYILTEEGTLDFAFMYLPSEAVFYEVANNIELLEYARQRRIYPVSPNTLYVHLQTVLLSFEGQKIQSRSRQVFRLLRAVQKDYEKTEGVLQVLHKHITNAYSQMNNAIQQFNLLGQKLSSTQSLSESEEERKQLKAELE